MKKNQSITDIEDLVEHFSNEKNICIEVIMKDGVLIEIFLKPNIVNEYYFILSFYNNDYEVDIFDSRIKYDFKIFNQKDVENLVFQEIEKHKNINELQ